MPKRQDAAIERVVTDHATVPALLHEAISGHDVGAHLRESDQQLHHPGLQLPSLTIHRDGAFRGFDRHRSKPELRLRGQIDARSGRSRLKSGHDRQ
jgi:hypothetical protein